MYLLVATASPDLMVGYSLVVDKTSGSFRVFGAALLIVFGLMVTAALRILFSGSEDNANVVANSVAVLFIADLVSDLCNICLPCFTIHLGKGRPKGGWCRRGVDELLVCFYIFIRSILVQNPLPHKLLFLPEARFLVPREAANLSFLYRIQSTRRE